MKLNLSQGTFKQKLDYADDSIDYIYSCHFLQKFTKAELGTIFKECKRVLRPGEIMRISVPDFYLLSDKYLKSQCRIDDINRILQDSKVFFDFIMLQKLMIQAGFYAVKRFDAERYNLDDNSVLELSGGIVSLNVEAYG